MNERIKQLAIQAGRDDSDGYPVLLEYSGRFAERFAELIIQECIQASESCTKEPESRQTDPLLEAYKDGVDHGIYEATEAIKEHFRKPAPKPKCSMCGTTENVRYTGGWKPYLCNSKDCILF